MHGWLPNDLGIAERTACCVAEEMAWAEFETSQKVLTPTPGACRSCGKNDIA